MRYTILVEYCVSEIHIITYLTAGDDIPSGNSTVVHNSDCIIGCVAHTFSVSSNHLTDSALYNIKYIHV